MHTPMFLELTDQLAPWTQQNYSALELLTVIIEVIIELFIESVSVSSRCNNANVKLVHDILERTSNPKNIIIAVELFTE